ncbi:hypothetical protein N9N67_11890, partial [Bacteriovoracaceae bacterium]|nr:hypothetical protein [Bacteriovoracaceae bacterium]
MKFLTMGLFVLLSTNAFSQLLNDDYIEIDTMNDVDGAKPIIIQGSEFVNIANVGLDSGQPFNSGISITRKADLNLFPDNSHLYIKDLSFSKAMVRNLSDQYHIAALKTLFNHYSGMYEGELLTQFNKLKEKIKGDVLITELDPTDTDMIFEIIKAERLYNSLPLFSKFNASTSKAIEYDVNGDLVG